MAALVPRRRHGYPTGAESAEQERQRAQRLLAQLRALGVEPQPDDAE